MNDARGSSACATRGSSPRAGWTIADIRPPRDLLRLVRVRRRTSSVPRRSWRRGSTGSRRRPGRDRVDPEPQRAAVAVPGRVRHEDRDTAGAGACLVATAARDGRRLVAIVLDAPGEPFSSAAALLELRVRRRWSDARRRRGRPARDVAIRGGTVPVVAGDDLHALVPTRGATSANAVGGRPDGRRSRRRPGSRSASLVVARRRACSGACRSSSPTVPPAPPTSGPWWLRDRLAVGGAVADAVRAARGLSRIAPTVAADRLLPCTAMTEVARVLFGREDVRRRVAELGRTITGDYVGREPVLVTVLKGGAMFLADLMRAVDLPGRAALHGDQPVRRRRGVARTRPDPARRRGRPHRPRRDPGRGHRRYGPHVAIPAVGPARARRRLRRAVHAAGQVGASDRAGRSRGTSGFDCPDAFVVGYGLDFRERYRNLPTSCRSTTWRRCGPTRMPCSLLDRRRRPEVARRADPRIPCQLAMIEMELTGVRVELPTNQPIVLLREKGGERYLPIWIGAVGGRLDRDGAAGGRHPAADDPRPDEDDPGRSVACGWSRSS